MAKKNTLQDRRESESKTAVGYHNSAMVCKDCLYRYDDTYLLGNSTKCEMYSTIKPIDVIRGGKCEEYVKE